MNKKFKLSIGTIGAICVPLVTVVSCAFGANDEIINPKKDILLKHNWKKIFRFRGKKNYF